LHLLGDEDSDWTFSSVGDGGGRGKDGLSSSSSILFERLVLGVGISSSRILSIFKKK
jgi:hypothetical protein